MFLKHLKLTNFRNFSVVDLDLSKTTLLVGNNAQGKSNLLESIYFLATSKSLRAEKDIQLIKHGENFCRVEGEEAEGEAVKLEIVLQKREEQDGVEKRVRVNGLPKRVMDYIGNLVVVYFSPEDINLVTGSPSLRRAYLDLTLSQVDREYKRALVNYSAALVAKNKILKRIQEGLSKMDELDFWAQEMIVSGAIISQKRQNFFKVINQESKKLDSEGKDMGQFSFVYQENLLSKERLAEYQGKEIVAGASLIGPHRDDFVFEMNGQNLAYFGSRGEQRTAVLELKLAELKFIQQLKETSPVLLLDDVFSELDATHRDYIISIIGNQQTILSAIETEQIPEEFVKTVQSVRIEKGEIVIKY